MGAAPVTYKDTAGTIIMYMDRFGSVLYKGTLYQSTGTSPPAGSVVFGTSQSSGVAWITPTAGDFYLKGTLNQNQGSLTPSTPSLKFANSTAIIGYIDTSGNFYIRGSANKMG
jgi:hypothetical protein